MAMMRATLTWQNSGEDEQSIILAEHKDYIIGRSNSCNVRLSDSQVSREHAKISSSSLPGEPIKFKLYVLSQNGVKVNNTENLDGTRYAPGVRQLNDGDVVMIRSAWVRFSLTEVEEEEEDEDEEEESIEDPVEVIEISDEEREIDVVNAEENEIFDDRAIGSEENSEGESNHLEEEEEEDNDMRNGPVQIQRLNELRRSLTLEAHIAHNMSSLGSGAGNSAPNSDYEDEFFPPPRLQRQQDDDIQILNSVDTSTSSSLDNFSMIPQVGDRDPTSPLSSTNEAREAPYFNALSDLFDRRDVNSSNNDRPTNSSSIVPPYPMETQQRPSRGFQDERRELMRPPSIPPPLITLGDSPIRPHSPTSCSWQTGPCCPGSCGTRDRFEQGPSSSRMMTAFGSSLRAKRHIEDDNPGPAKVERKETSEEAANEPATRQPPDNQNEAPVAAEPENYNYTEELFNCSICMAVSYHVTSIYPCMHKFCHGCILEWRNGQGVVRGTCPECRQPITGLARDQKMASVIDVFLANNPDKVREPEELAVLEEKEVKFARPILPARPEFRDDRDPSSVEMVESLRTLEQLRRNVVPSLSSFLGASASASGSGRISSIDTSRDILRILQQPPPRLHDTLAAIERTAETAAEIDRRRTEAIARRQSFADDSDSEEHLMLRNNVPRPPRPQEGTERFLQARSRMERLIAENERIRLNNEQSTSSRGGGGSFRARPIPANAPSRPQYVHCLRRIERRLPYDLAMAAQAGAGALGEANREEPGSISSHNAAEVLPAYNRHQSTSSTNSATNVAVDNAARRPQTPPTIDYPETVARVRVLPPQPLIEDRQEEERGRGVPYTTFEQGRQVVHFGRSTNADRDVRQPVEHNFLESRLAELEEFARRRRINNSDEGANDN